MKNATDLAMESSARHNIVHEYNDCADGNVDTVINHVGAGAFDLLMAYSYAGGNKNDCKIGTDGVESDVANIIARSGRVNNFNNCGKLAERF